MMQPDEIRKTLAKADELIAELKAARAPAGGQVQRIEFHGAGHVFGTAGLGFICGGILVGAVMIASWVSSTVSRISAQQLQNEAYISATYQSVPHMREQFDKIKAEQAKKQE